MERLPLKVLNALLGVERLIGVEVVEIAGRGRGVRATAAHASQAAVVPFGDPLAHSGTTPFALPPPSAEDASSIRARYEATYAAAVASLGGDRRYPLLVAQIASRVAHEPAEGSAFAVAVASLCSARLPEIPEPWKEDREALVAALDAPCDWLTDRWYGGVCSRVHLNAMRADSAGDATVLHLLPSYLNHERDPTLLIDYDNRRFVAARDLEPGTELTIDYGPPEGVDRAAFFLDHYGFQEEGTEWAGPPTTSEAGTYFRG